jgi:putative peptide zinc metalloprotease protein
MAQVTTGLSERTPGAATGQPIAGVEVPERPTLAPNVQLAGELQGTGFEDRQWLLQRNSRFLQVTELVYRIAEHADGEHTLEEIAAAVSQAMDRLVSPDQIGYILRTMLIPRGLVAMAGGYVVPTLQDQVRSALLVNMRARMIGGHIVNPITDVLRVLYAPAVLIPILIAVTLAHVWLYFVHGLAGGLRAALFTPGGLAVVLAVVIVSGLFHELGHAAALHYGGGRTRGIGAGLYLVYPAFYTDVTDSYRLGRWARLRTDLGGFYFHLIFALGLVAISVVSGDDLPLFAVLVIDLMILRQCLPFVRMDGYWALADLTGLPDFFSLIGPFVRSLLPASATNSGGSRLPRLKAWVKAVFVVYIVVAVPLLALLFVVLIVSLPQLLATTWEALSLQVAMLSSTSSVSDAPRALAALTQIVFLALPLLGITYLLYATSRKLVRAIWTWSKPTPKRRIAGTFATAAVVGLLGLAWAPRLHLDQPPFTQPSTPAGVQSFQVTQRDHVGMPVIYAQAPPVGGNHTPIWQNCGFYASDILNEYGVHSMEHGAVWITYRRDLPQHQVDVLQQLAQHETFVLVSAYQDLVAPVVASAWGRQLVLDSADHAQLSQFVRAFRLGAQAPERGGPCSGGFGQPA